MMEVEEIKKKKREIAFGTFFKKKIRKLPPEKKKEPEDFQPMFLGQMFITKKGITMLTLDKKIILKIPSRKVKKTIVEIISQCDGVTKLKEIYKRFESKGYSIKEIENLFEQLKESRTILDSREMYLLFHKCLINPTFFYYELSDEEIFSFFEQKNELSYQGVILQLKINKNSAFTQLLEKRKTTRKFKRTRPLSFEEFSGILWTTYGISGNIDLNGITIPRRTTPSAGALYPLHVHCLVWGEVENLSPGIYYLKKAENAIQKIKESIDIEEIKEVLVPVIEKEMVENAIMLLVISANFKRSSQKYANRGYLYTLLEAGHAAQNCYLYCTERGLGVVEIGGFKEEKMATLLELKYPEEMPLTTLLIGIPKE